MLYNATYLSRLNIHLSKLLLDFVRFHELSTFLGRKATLCKVFFFGSVTERNCNTVDLLEIANVYIENGIVVQLYIVVNDYQLCVVLFP